MPLSCSGKVCWNHQIPDTHQTHPAAEHTYFRKADGVRNNVCQHMLVHFKLTFGASTAVYVAPGGT